ncbi:MAG: hypothetical protein H0W70_00580 [Actinobacteria bacterium]|nr:hypothetical protein [Actinomycetota bacterium]
MRRLVLSVLLVSAVAAGFIAPAHASTADHRVTGNFFRQAVTPGYCIRDGYSASSDAQGIASGSITVTEYPCDSSGNVTGQATARATVNVTCLDVTGNRIVLSGPITSATGIYSGWTNLQEISFDNSPSSPDTDVNVRYNGAVTCAPLSSVQVPIISGDIRIVS